MKAKQSHCRGEERHTSSFGAVGMQRSDAPVLEQIHVIGEKLEGDNNAERQRKRPYDARHGSIDRQSDPEVEAAICPAIGNAQAFGGDTGLIGRNGIEGILVDEAQALAIRQPFQLKRIFEVFGPI